MAIGASYEDDYAEMCAEIARLRAERDQLLAALKDMVDAWDMSDDEGQHRRIWDRASAAIAAVNYVALVGAANEVLRNWSQGHLHEAAAVDKLRNELENQGVYDETR